MKESESIELKRSLVELKDGLISMAAILNKHGAGELWFGVRSDGIVVSLDVTEKTLRDISQVIAAHIEPKIFPHITLETLTGKTCVKVAFTGKEAPYFAYGRAYMRVADEDRQLTAKELESLILIKNRKALRWDNKPYQGSLKMLDGRKIKRFVTRAGLVWDNIPNALEKLGLLENGQPLNAARLFFSKTPPIQLRCAVFAGTKSDTIIDRHDFDGDILELIEEAQKYILKNIHIGMRLKGLYREDVPEISVAALREAVINAFCHRDYRDPDYIHIAVFKDRVEIRSPGGLFEGLTIREIRKGNVSKRRNPLIADLFRRIKMVEAWGRGMPLILQNEPSAKFKVIANIFIAGFDRPSFVESGVGAGDMTPQVTPQVAGARSRPESQPESQPESLKNRVLRLLMASAMRKAEISLALGQKEVSGQLNKIIRELLAENIIEYTIPEKPNSRLQKYCLTLTGRDLVVKLANEAGADEK
ncbi:MAG TPA: ATP-binding protein [Syntrophales bacterium]|nr:ATP-binding protein [Syntrophales bacterium]